MVGVWREESGRKVCGAKQVQLRQGNVSTRATVDRQQNINIGLS